MPVSRPTCWCEIVAPWPKPRSRPSRAARTTSAFELPPSTARTAARASATGERRDGRGIEAVDPDEVGAGVAQPGDHRQEARQRPVRPGVEQDDRAVAVGDRAVDDGSRDVL